ncbi:MAG: CoA transferase, partial [Chloroflexi bacterium]|nr:CoA transferase [Chloroflexota bacterium]
VKNADVVIENFAPGLMEKLNLDYPVLRETNPRIIMARLKGFGLDGPYRDYKCFEMIAQAAGGVMAGNGFPDKEPVRLGAGIGDTGTGIHAAAAILAAYIQRQRTGRGQLVECSMQEVITNFLRIRYMDHYRAEAPATRLGNELVGSVPSGVYPCAPGGPNDYVYIYSQPNIPKMWDDLVRAIGRPDLIDDPRCVDAATRYENRQELNPIISDWTRQRDKHEVMRILGEAGIPCSGVFDTADVLNDPHLNARGQIVDVEHAVRGKLKMPGCPVRLSESPAVQAPVPLLGEHTADILAEVLGKSADDVETLRGRGVVR